MIGRTARCGLFFFDVMKVKIRNFPDIVWKIGLSWLNFCKVLKKKVLSFDYISRLCNNVPDRNAK